MAYARAYNTDHQSRLLLEAASMMVETRYSTVFNIVTVNQSQEKLWVILSVVLYYGEIANLFIT